MSVAILPCAISPLFRVDKNVPTWRPIFPGAQGVHDEEPTVGVDFPRPHLVHSLSVAVSLRLLSRNFPARQLAHGLAVAEMSSATSNVVPA